MDARCEWLQDLFLLDTDHHLLQVVGGNMPLAAATPAVGGILALRLVGGDIDSGGVWF